MNHFDLGGAGEPLHFLHANGYPPDCYKPLLQLLAIEYRVIGMHLRPLWRDSKPEELQSWHPFSHDLLRFLDEHIATPVIGIGHSIGAIVTLRAALLEPNRFKALILIEPVLFRVGRLILWRLFRSIGLGDRVHPLIAGAKKRRRTFEDLEAVFSRYRTRTIFRYMSDEYLRIYVEGITRRTASGYELVYSPEWEAHVYLTGLQDFDLWRGLPKLKVPSLYIRGAESDTFLDGTARLIEQKQPRVRIDSLPRSTHLLPLEHPRQVVEIMKSFLKEV